MNLQEEIRNSLDGFSVQNASLEEIQNEAKRIAIEFAKYHVKLALEAAANKSLIIRRPTGEGKTSNSYIGKDFEGDLGYEDYIPVSYSILESSILESYPLTNIK